MKLWPPAHIVYRMRQNTADNGMPFLKMTIRVHTYEIAKSDTGTDERCKTPAKGTFSQFDHIGTSFAERRAFTDGRT